MAQGTCSINACAGTVVARGWCSKHYARWKRHGDPRTFGFRYDCAVPDCQAPHYSLSYCRSHWHAFKRWDSPVSAPRPQVCVVDECEGAANSGARGYCRKHYKRVQRYGDPRGVCLTCTFCGSPFYPVNSLRRVCDDCTLSTIRQHGMNAAAIAERDGATCSLCHRPVDMTIPYPDRRCGTVDHIIPWSLGGTHDPSNLALAHFHCNASKGNRVA